MLQIKKNKSFGIELSCCSVQCLCGCRNFLELEVNGGNSIRDTGVEKISANFST
jgi:hypothetical protein